MGFAEELVKNRKAVDLTQEALAEKCNVSRQAVQKWEKGESLPDVYLIAKLANMFNCTIEDLIWSRDTAIFENKQYYIRQLEEADKREFCLLMREHRYLGPMLKLVDKIENQSEVDAIYWDGYLHEGKTYAIRLKDGNSFAGYLYFEGIETNSPEMTMQFDKTKLPEGIDFNMMRDFFNWIHKEFKIRAIHVYTNSKMERDMFAYFGYENVKDDLMLALPIQFINQHKGAGFEYLKPDITGIVEGESADKLIQRFSEEEKGKAELISEEVYEYTLDSTLFINS